MQTVGPDGQKDMTKPKVALPSFVNVPQKLFPYIELTDCSFYWNQTTFSAEVRT